MKKTFLLLPFFRLNAQENIEYQELPQEILKLANAEPVRTQLVCISTPIDVTRSV
ncbi:hypothetical protein [uncultured Kordia sp.]|uniref:hypothetical protein n=1 Tax=uncultured Kordia sp. TaxID=507699 RepID=UPI0026293C32|nr:hypothetical protein [uncultured Kordia sp.]